MTETLKLHLGCGMRRLEGWTHVDSRVEVMPDLIADVTNLIDFADNSAEIVYVCHVLEHIPRLDVLSTLKEWKRILKPGGTLRLSVPSFYAVVKLYEQNVPMWRLIGLVCGRQDYPENTHYSIYDYDYLAWLMTEAGFYDIKRWNPDEVLPEGYDDYSKAKIDGRSVSLNVEGTA